MKCQEATVIGTWDVLVVDADPALGDLVKAAPNAATLRIRTAASTDQAQAEMKLKSADLVLVNLQINDNAGLALIKKMRAAYPKADLIAVSRVKRSELCLDAWRAGAADLLVAPIAINDLHRSLTTIMQRRLQ